MRTWRFAEIPADRKLFEADRDRLDRQAAHVSAFEASGWTIFNLTMTYGGAIFVAMYKEIP